MKNTIVVGVVIAVVIAAAYFGSRKTSDRKMVPPTEKQSMSFFITSKNPGKGADLGGLAGADAYCNQLATAAGVSGKTWAAYLSATATGTQAAVNARDRIGSGPWYNRAGERIASSVEELHSAGNITKATALNEKGEQVSGRGDSVNMHDMLTGSTDAGMASTTATTDTTCANWTSSTAGSATLGHHDRVGINDSPAMKSWVSSHASRDCSPDGLKATGGAGLYYCFAK